MKSNTPIISIIIPVFNTEDYLARCFDSIINQSLKDIEIIIVNDLSTDNSEKIILDYVKQYDFIKYFKMKSKGSAGGTRNLGIENAIGKYLGFVDSDDWVDTMMFEKLVAAAEKSHAEIAMCGVLSEYGGAHETEKRHEYTAENIMEGKAAFGLLTRFYNQDIVISPVVCNKIYSTKFIKGNQYSFLINNLNDDDIFNFICFLQVNTVAIVPNTYYHYYQRQNSIMHHFSIKHMDDLVGAYTMLHDYLHENNQFELVRNSYYSYLDLNMSAMFRILISSEPDPVKQNEYIDYFLTKVLGTLITKDYIHYVGIKRIHTFLTSSFKRP